MLPNPSLTLMLHSQMRFMLHLCSPNPSLHISNVYKISKSLLEAIGTIMGVIMWLISFLALNRIKYCWICLSLLQKMCQCQVGELVQAQVQPQGLPGLLGDCGHHIILPGLQKPKISVKCIHLRSKLCHRQSLSPRA